MKITKLKTNHIINPLGFDLGKPSLSFITCDTTASRQEAAQIQVALDEKFSEIIFDSGKSIEIDSLAYELSIELKARTRYYWRVTVWADNGETETSDTAWFETAKMEEPWTGKWITPAFNNKIHPILTKEFKLEKPIKTARAYVSGLGLYEMKINNNKCGDEYLAPNFNAYDKWIQYQTYNVTSTVVEGSNKIEIALGNGLYKGRFGFKSDENIYGDKFSLICEIVIEFEDGTNLVINSDETWKARKSKVQESNLYDGESYDSTFEDKTSYEVKESEIGFEKLKARLSLPVKIKERLKVIKVIKTPAGETVLDLGQNMVGWLEFKTKAPKGTKIILQYGELLQEGNFYRENLRTAKAEYKYIANGEETMVRPYFTFYGFRYVKIEGWPEEINPNDFTGCVLYSDMEVTGHIETSDPLVNRLFLNALWGQKGNFLDIPTDCPQRDERMGWTGDAQVFSGTACFNMDTFAFFNKYGYDLYSEQKDKAGMVPMVIPATNIQGGGSSAWADAATVIPWNVYVQYGDKKILEQQFESMKAWIDYIKRADDNSGETRLWTTGFHFGDWLALDGTDPTFPTGGTDVTFIASAYYCYSARLVSKAAKILGKEELAKEYEALSNEIREAIRDEYFSKTGRSTINTQTALTISLFMELAPEDKRERVANDLRERFKKDKNYLKTGFVGTPYLCKVLSENGCNDLAYTLLLNKDCPSWLYSVIMGATTIWERWNSIMPDGKINPEGMNSLNHYAYGSIAEWMYRYMAGINPVEDKPGFRHIKLNPMPDYRLKYMKAFYNSSVGTYKSEWKITEEGNLNYNFVIPFNATAELILPDARLENIRVNSILLKETTLNSKQDGKNVTILLTSGSYEINYVPEAAYIKYYGVDTSLSELAENEEVKKLVAEKLPMMMADAVIKSRGYQSLRELSFEPFSPITKEILKELETCLGKIKIQA